MDKSEVPHFLWPPVYYLLLLMFYSYCSDVYLLFRNDGKYLLVWKESSIPVHPSGLIQLYYYYYYYYY